ncbi:MAG TPA: hypothetical protein PLV45_00015 [bacterium]|nr:hypothetical protein [bacterium]
MTKTHGKHKEIPQDLVLNLSFPEEPGVRLFNSPAEVFQSTLKRFSRMLRRLRKGGTSAGDRAFRRRKVASRMTGRKIRLVPYHPDRHSLALYETVLRSFLRRGRHRPGTRIEIRTMDYLGWERQVEESLTLVLAVDVSRSTVVFKDLFANIIRNLSAHFNRHRDRIGLISVCGWQAEILNHPSRNHRVVAKSILQLSILGESPLADGLMKSLDMVRMERTRNPGSKPIVILLSDCFPEPITHKYLDILDEPMYRDVIGAADLFRRRGVSLLVINPSYRDESYIAVMESTHRPTPGERLTDRIIQRSAGQLIKLQTRVFNSLLTQTTTVTTEKHQMQDIMASIEAAFTGRQDRRERPGLSP